MALPPLRYPVHPPVGLGNPFFDRGGSTSTPSKHQWQGGPTDGERPPTSSGARTGTSRWNNELQQQPSVLQSETDRLLELMRTPLRLYPTPPTTSPNKGELDIVMTHLHQLEQRVQALENENGTLRQENLYLLERSTQLENSVQGLTANMLTLLRQHQALEVQSADTKVDLLEYKQVQVSHVTKQLEDHTHLLDLQDQLDQLRLLVAANTSCNTSFIAPSWTDSI